MYLSVWLFDSFLSSRWCHASWVRQKRDQSVLASRQLGSDRSMSSETGDYGYRSCIGKQGIRLLEVSPILLTLVAFFSSRKPPPSLHTYTHAHGPTPPHPSHVLQASAPLSPFEQACLQSRPPPPCGNNSSNNPTKTPVPPLRAHRYTVKEIGATLDSIELADLRPLASRVLAEAEGVCLMQGNLRKEDVAR